ncbi:YpdA family putative bacillithiol disulfide reductase [Rhizosphaericola mali]|uniref:YpdA family putative bacillithiol disulfide reductase n=1 Tax=Rhizosphaericola mali TaxID=2545455 RepID=A0A5P2FXA5_9BACT|nr:YpdA family putative bacillithiol disulfide reductase [Rhizosphaericola mali]QES87557.1 YpdA family putative bacillithiol disulfide reductase [Rhizosphaericola mali]
MVNKDLIIIGAGPIGLSCGIEAKKAGLDYTIIDKGALTNSIFNYPIFMRFFSTAERLGIGDLPFMCIAPKPGRQEALEYYRNVVEFFQLKVQLFEEIFSVQKEADGTFTVTSAKATYKAKYIVIATGFYDIPMYLNVPGEDLPKVRHYYKEPHEYAFQKVIVVGASNSSVDAALETWHKGAEVTIVVRGEEIGQRVKYWVKPDMENRIKEGSIKALFHSNIKAIRENEVDIETPDGVITMENDFVLALTGYRPNFDFLEKIGIQLEGATLHPSHDETTMETNVANMYLAGVVCGGLETHLWFIENSKDHAGRIMQSILTKENKA